MSVELTPATTIGFPRPLTQLVKRSLTIHNPNPHPIAFKVKTTAPKQYCVRPNSGRVESGESVEVQVLLQPLSADPPPHAKCKDKFLVQSAFITPDEEMRTLMEMWAQTEKTNKTAIQEQKIKCAYLPAEDGSTGANGIPEENEEPHSGEPSRIEESQIYGEAQSSPAHHNGSLERSKPQSPVTPTSPVQQKEPSQPAAPATAPAQPAQAPIKARSIPSLSAYDIQLGGPSPTNRALESSLQMKASDSDKLKVALAEIDKLKTQLSESQAQAQGPAVNGMRKRGGVDGTSSGTEVAVEKAKEVVSGQQGVPLGVVVGLVVGVFVLTYTFF